MEPLPVDATASAGSRVVVMGVSGCGKSTVGELLATALDAEFLDGDALHPASNIEKMGAGIPLDDDDREPWLREIGARLGDAAAAERSLVIGCSALKHSYRALIRDAASDTSFVHLHGSRAVLDERMSVRDGHFMPASLLDSQLATLEELESGESGRVFDIVASPRELAADAAVWLRGAGEAIGKS